MTTQYEFIPPGSTQRVWAWISPGRTWGVALILCPWMFHIGLELWPHGVTFNVGPLSLGIAGVRELGTAQAAQRLD